MPLEQGDKIGDLNALWPLGSDPKSQGDDHIRLVKAVMQNDVLSLSDGGTVTGDVTADNLTATDAIAGVRGVFSGDVTADNLLSNGNVFIRRASIPAVYFRNDANTNFGRLQYDLVNDRFVYVKYIDGANPREVAQIADRLADGGTLDTNLSVVTREHGDARYALKDAGQTWTDVRGSRVGGVSYQNDTGKPIMVSLSARDDGNPQFQISTDNATWVPIASVVNDIGNNVLTSVQAIVPDGHWYRLSGTAQIAIWSELR